MDAWLTHDMLPIVHGFTTRKGGVSTGPYAALNLGLSSGDERSVVEQNRDWLLTQVVVPRERVAAYNQVHGAVVADGEPSWFTSDADAATTNEPGVMLVMSVADCLPIIMHDTQTGAVAAVHAGWRGTVAGVARATVAAMGERYGTKPEHLTCVLGPAISQARYEVGPEVVAAFREANLGAAIGDEQPNGHAQLDVRGANVQQLSAAGVTRIAHLARCTAGEPEWFYSHRRDRGVTGRHWAFVVRSE